MPNNTAIVPISLPKKLAKELDWAAKKESMTRSEYIRSSLRRQLAFTKIDEFRNKLSRGAKKAGLITLQDAVRAVRKVRNKK